MDKKWIDVKTGLPRKRRPVLVYRGGDTLARPSMRYEIAYHLGDGIFTVLDVTHWMYVPDPPDTITES